MIVKPVHERCETARSNAEAHVRSRRGVLPAGRGNSMDPTRESWKQIEHTFTHLLVTSGG